MALLSRASAGYDHDLFVFRYKKKVYKRFYGDRYTDRQAINLFRKEIRSGEL